LKRWTEGELFCHPTPGYTDGSKIARTLDASDLPSPNGPDEIIVVGIPIDLFMLGSRVGDKGDVNWISA
jgi:hypothetical protein